MPRRLIAHVGLVLAAGLIGVPAEAQLARLTPEAGEVGIEMRALSAMRSRIAERKGANESFVSTWVNLPLSGTLLSSRFLTYHAAFRPTRSEQAVRGDGLYRLNTIGLNGGASLFSAAPVSLTVHADRTTAAAPGDVYGASTGFRNGSSGGLLRLRIPAFPARFEWNSFDRADEWQSAPTDAPIRRDESLNVLRLAAESSKMTAVLERQSFVDRVGTLDFRSTAATLSHRLRWGKGSSLMSTLESHAREGREGQRRGLFAEHLHLQHAPTVASDLTVHRQRSRSEGGRFADIATLLLAVNGELGPRTMGSLAASRVTNGFDAGQLRTHSVAPSITWRRGLGSNGRILASAGVNVQRTDQRLVAGQSTPISDESYVVDDTRSVLLRRLRVDPASVQVFNRDRTAIYLEDVDYRVRQLGDELRLEIPLVSRIAPGDLILVSYLFVAPAARLHDLATTSLGLSLSRGGVTLSQSSSLRRVRLISGDDEGLEGGDDHVTALEWRRAGPVNGLTLGAQHRSRGGARANFTVSELRSMITRTLGEERSANLAATYQRSSAGAQRATVWTTQATLAWALTDRARVGAGAESQLWRLDGQGADRTSVLTADLRWRGGRMESELRYVWQQRTTLERRSQSRVVARLTRRF